MSTGKICVSQEETLPNSWIELKAILTRDEKSPFIIHKVPPLLRQVNEKAYEPRVISIGPYHHGKPQLKEMEDMKKSFFIKTVGESNEDSNTPDVEAKSREKKKIKAIKDLETAIRENLERIKECYDGNIFNFESEQKFVDMVLFDGFLIVQLIMGYCPEEVYERQCFDEILSDLLLIENQLPFFVLVRLHQIITQTEEAIEEFIERTLNLFGGGRNSELPIPKENIKHLLHLIQDTLWLPSKMEALYRPFPRARWGFIRCATELENAGISFERRDEWKCWTPDIEFKSNFIKGKLRIPKLIVDQHTECRSLNLIAFEQSFGPDEPTYVFDYVKFLDLLINSGKDVQLLCYSGIIENYLGEYEAIAQVFNRLCLNAHGSACFYYADVLEEVHLHCHNNWRQQMAYLQRTYFNSAWALLSFLAALLLILLTMAQTIFTLLSTDCVPCLVVFIVFVVSLIVIGLLFCFFFSFR